MRSLRRTTWFCVAVLLPVAATAATAAHAADYPEKAIRLIVPFPAGSGPDANARVLTAGLARPLGQQMIIDNRPGERHHRHATGCDASPRTLCRYWLMSSGVTIG